jgi:hypothetical protein
MGRHQRSLWSAWQSQRRRGRRLPAVASKPNLAPPAFPSCPAADTPRCMVTSPRLIGNRQPCHFGSAPVWSRLDSSPLPAGSLGPAKCDPACSGWVLVMRPWPSCISFGGLSLPSEVPTSLCDNRLNQAGRTRRVSIGPPPLLKVDRTWTSSQLDSLSRTDVVCKVPGKAPRGVAQISTCDKFSFRRRRQSSGRWLRTPL